MLILRTALTLTLFLLPALATAQTVIAVIDSGVDANSPDLAGKLVPGFDFVEGDSDPDDILGHGTEMAGILVSTGIHPGICTDCRVMPLKVTHELGLAGQNLIADAIEFAIASGADAIMVGVATGGSGSDLTAAVNAAEAAGIPIVAPAGNEQLEQTFYPAAHLSVISVVALDPNQRLSSFANSTLLETVAEQGELLPSTVDPNGVMGGSSVSAARVAGAVGLLLTTNSTLTPAQLRQIIHFGVDPLPIDRFDEFFEMGALNTSKAFARSASDFSDIAVTRLTRFPDTPIAGQDHFVRARFINQGNVPTTVNLPISVVVDSVVVVTGAIPSLGLGESLELDLPLPAGLVGTTASVTITAAGDTGETELANNSRSTLVSYVTDPIHDVQLEIGALSDPIVEADTLSIPITVRNRGNQNEPNVTVDLFIDAEPIQSFAVSLDAGDETQLVGSWTLPLEPQGYAALRVSVSIADPDVDAFGDDWYFTLRPQSQDEPAITQYADIPEAFQVVMDAPWMTVRSYAPVLFFLPEFPADAYFIDHFEIFNIKIAQFNPLDLKGKGELIARDVVNSIKPELLNGIEAVTAFGQVLPGGAGVTDGRVFKRMWHYILRVPRDKIDPAIPAGESAFRHIVALTRYRKYRKNHPQHYDWTRTLKILFSSEELPRFDARDRHYDVHVHTIAEQTSWLPVNPNAGRKNYGGPVVMLLESAYALGMVKNQVTVTESSGGPEIFTGYKNKIVTTDHSVFYSGNTETGSKEDYDSGIAPSWGPTDDTNGRDTEFEWYRDVFGNTAAEEIALKTPFLTQVIPSGYHFLAYQSNHFEGPWNGGSLNPWTMEKALRHMDTNGLLPGINFAYAAHPNFKPQDYPETYFDQAIGLRSNNSSTGPAIHTPSGEFIYRGSQLWNEKEEGIRAINLSEIKRLDPFSQASKHRFEIDNEWEELLDESLKDYYDRLANAMIFSFQKSDRTFIRKIYMAGGSDAHGDFNYKDDVRATAAAWVIDLKRFTALGSVKEGAKVTSNAFARVRTYTLVHDRKDASSDPNNTIEAVRAYRDGNTVLTDGPLAMFWIDSDARHDANGGTENVDRWHDATVLFENQEGRIGGGGDLDGARSAIIPQNDDVFIQTMWRGGIQPGATNEPNHFTLRKIEREMFGSAFRAKKTEISLPVDPNGDPLAGSLQDPLEEMAALFLEFKDDDVKERALTNAVWTIPLEIELRIQAPCPTLEVIGFFDFPISIHTHSGVYIQQLDATGVSQDPNVRLEPLRPEDAGWLNRGNVSHRLWAGKAEIACQDDRWDSVNHIPDPNYQSFVIWMNDPQENGQNILNDVGATLRVRHDCGNGATESGEGCDDGNSAPGDGCESNCEQTAFDLISGKKLKLRDRLGDPRARKLTLVSKDPVTTTPAAGSLADPRLTGSTLHLINPTTGESDTYDLPASGWKALGKNPEGSKGYLYKDKGLVNGPCKKVQVRPGKGVKASCTGDRILFSLDEPTQGSLTATLSLGFGEDGQHYCMAFGGSVRKDFGTGTQFIGSFEAKDAPAPMSCPLP